MTHATIHGDCIDRVTSQIGDRVLFERLDTPRPAPKVTLKQNWQSQRAAFHFWHRRTLLLEAGLKKGRPGWSTRRYGPLHRSQPSPQETGAYHLEHGCGYLCRWQRSQHTCTLEERSCERKITETNTIAIERVKIGSNKICIREDLAKEHMMFSKESSQAVFEMGNVIKNSMPIMSTLRFQRNNHLHVASTSDPTRRWHDVWKQLVKFLKHHCSVRLSWPQEVTNMDPTCGRNITTRQKTHYEVREWTRERIRRSGIDGKMTRRTGSPNSPLAGQMLGYVRCLGKMPRPHRTDWYLSYSVAWTTRQISQSGLASKLQFTPWARCTYIHSCLQSLSLDEV